MTQGQSSGPLAEWGRYYLKQRGLSDDVIAERGYLTAPKGKVKELGFGTAARAGLVIPIFPPYRTDEPVLHQLRPEEPRRNSEGKPLKFEFPAKSRMRLDVHPRMVEQVRNPALPLIIIEGVVKGDACVSRLNVATVALAGVWNFKTTDCLADWDDIPFGDGRNALVVFDSDSAHNDSVAHAMIRLGSLLERRGAEVRYVYLPSGEHGAKVGIDDWLADQPAERTPSDLLQELVSVSTDTLTPQNRRNRATVGVYQEEHAETPRNRSRNPAQPPAQSPPLAKEPAILSKLPAALHQQCGLVGEEANVQIIYLGFSSRLLVKPAKPASLTIKGLSSAGKSSLLESVAKTMPEGSLYERTAISGKALLHTAEKFAHRTVVLYEATALESNDPDDKTSYLIRSLLSEGRIEYEYTIRGENGQYTTELVSKPGPTNLIMTTTKTRIHDENETRALSLQADDSPDQTRRVIMAIAQDRPEPDLTEWVQLQRWLEGAEHRVVVPYAEALAKLCKPAAVRLRRDFTTMLSLVQAHAILHQLNRKRDEAGRVVASLQDYMVVHRLIAPLVSEGIGHAVSDATRDTVEAVEKLQGESGTMVVAVAKELSIDKSNASRRLRVAADKGFIVNDAVRGKPAHWRRTEEPLPDPESEAVLPTPRAVAKELRRLRAVAVPVALPNGTTAQVDGHGCAVAPILGGDNAKESLPPHQTNGKDLRAVPTGDEVPTEAEAVAQLLDAFPGSELLPDRWVPPSDEPAETPQEQPNGRLRLLADDEF